MKLTVNQRSKTVEQAEVARKDFLTQLASSLEWDVRHWAKRQELLERLSPKIADMRAALQAVVGLQRGLARSTCSSLSLRVEASKRNDNEHFGAVFGRVIEVSEEKRQELAESVWQDGEAARGRGEAVAAAALFEKAIDARGRGLCADDKQGRDRIVAMRRVLMEVRGGGEDNEAQARLRAGHVTRACKAVRLPFQGFVGSSGRVDASGCASGAGPAAAGAAAGRERMG
jgi:hypothetical protein